MIVEAETHDAILSAAFADGVQVEFVARGRIRLLKPVGVRVRVARNRVVPVTVPDGFECDGASVPPLFWAVVGHPLAGSALVPAIVHDYLCRVRTMPSKAVHQLFYCCLRDHCVSWLRATLMYRAVAMFGPKWTTLPSVRG